MKQLTQEWDRFSRTLDDVRETIDQVLEHLPQYGTARKVRTQIEKRWQNVIDAADGLDELIYQQTGEIEIDYPWRDQDFIDTWQLYKDYLLEQHHLTMRSRMENVRLKNILKYSNNDKSRAIEMLEYYISYGSNTIYPVTFTEISSSNGKATTAVSILKLN